MSFSFDFLKHLTPIGSNSSQLLPTTPQKSLSIAKIDRNVSEIELSSSIPTKRVCEWSEFDDSPIQFEKIGEKRRFIRKNKVFSANQNSSVKAIQINDIKTAILEAIKPLTEEIKSLKQEILSLKEENVQFSSKIAQTQSNILKKNENIESICVKSTQKTAINTPKIAEKAIQKSTEQTAKKTFAEIAKLNCLVSEQSTKLNNWTLVGKKRPINKELAPKKGLKIEDRRFLFLREKSAQSTTKINLQDLLLAVNSAIQKCGFPSHIRLYRLWETPLGAISGALKEGASVEMLNSIKNEIIKAAKTVDSSIISFQASEQWYSLRIDKIPLDRYLIPTGMNTLKEEIEVTTGLNLPYLPRWVNKKKAEDRYNKGEILFSSIIITVRSKAVADGCIAKGVDFGGKFHKATLFIETKFDKICLKCSDFGHNSYTCKNTAKCYICGKNHEGNEHKCSINGCTTIMGKKCSHFPLKCVNCGGNHATTSSYCPKRLELVKTRKNNAKKERELPLKSQKIAVIIPKPSLSSEKMDIEASPSAQLC